MIWCNKTLTEFELVQHQISFAGDIRLSFALPKNHIFVLIQQVFHISSFVFECYNDIATTHFRDFFTPISSIHSYNTTGATCGDFPS